MFLGLQTSEWLLLWRDFCLAIAWFVAIVYCVSGAQDVWYDLWGAGWRLYRRVRYARRPRLTLERLRLRAQQRIAVFVPAWHEAEVVDRMVENILHRVEYRDYTIFVGTYPNDPATQQAVDTIAAAHPQVIKVVTAHPGPTNKADCLNTIYAAMRAYERQQEVYFDIIVMHDAEDVVHPYSFLLYNYLLPRKDVVQLPILPLPVEHHKLIHWIYADEFAENHLKDIVVREKMGGFVPYAGVGTGFSRRTFLVLEERQGGKLFNEGAMTEDYSFSKQTRDAGLSSIFVNLVLGDDHSPWWTPLARRPGFIANWSYFPLDIVRSIRQKTRWIIGISLQEWERSGWKGDWRIKENLLKDRKVFISFGTAFLGYAVFGYSLIAELGERGYLPFHWLPIIQAGTLLYDFVLIATGLMFLRLFQRIVFVTMVYGLVAGLLSPIRACYGNIVNGVAAYRALVIYLASRRGKAVPWDKTDHQEGVGTLPTTADVAPQPAAHGPQIACPDFVLLMHTATPWEVITALERINPACSDAQRAQIGRGLQAISRSDDHHIRAVAARAIGTLRWPEMVPVMLELLYDREWVVRANAARALIRCDGFTRWLNDIFTRPDRYTWEVVIHTLEQDERALETLLRVIDDPAMAPTRDVLLRESLLFRTRYGAREATAMAG